MIRPLSGDRGGDPRKAPAGSPVTPACAVVRRSLPGSRAPGPVVGYPHLLFTRSALKGVGQRGSPVCIRWAVQSLRMCSPFLIVACGRRLSGRGAVERPTRCAAIASYGVMSGGPGGVAGVTGCGDGRWPARPWHPAPRR